MAELSALYANALFKLALEGGATDEIYGQAVYINGIFKDAECRKILVHPHISNMAKREFFSNVFEGRVHEDLFALLRLVIDKNREQFFIPAIRALIGLIERHQRKTTATVVSAAGLSAAQVASLKKILSEKLNKAVEISFKLDPSVIGGPFINVDGYYIDRTIKRKLLDLAANMKVGCGA